MNIALKSLSLLMVLALGFGGGAAMAAGFVETVPQWQSDTMIAQYDQRDARRGQQQQQRGERREQPDANRGRPDDRGGDAQRSGRMSPEERRALRRQIDEAGHDIYSRKQR